MTEIVEINGIRYLINEGKAIPIVSDNKATDSKQSKKATVKAKEQTPYSEIPNILKKMSATENIKRFGILYNSDNPYSIAGSSIEKFHKDYNIKTFMNRNRYLSYDNKDIIIDGQLQKHKTFKKKCLENRIKYINDRIKDVEKRKPSGKYTVNNKDKQLERLISRLEKLEGLLNG